MSASGEEQRLPNHAVLDEEAARRYAELTSNGVFDLLPSERFWRERQPYLQQHGYQLRSRYLPGWEPSWKGTRLDPLFCEDSIMLINFHVIDAKRVGDNKLVAIKKFRNDNHESRIALYLSSLTDIQNHCVRIEEILPDPFDPQLSLMVMPYLRPCNDPDFSTVGDVIDFVNQTLEGLVFMHRHRVAHRDIALMNIMMDASSLYPDGHHPVRTGYTADARYQATALPRGSRSVTYVYIDFGLSSQFPEGVSTYVVGCVGRDKEAPELSSTVPYDPFKVDIFALGNLYFNEFQQKYINTDFLTPIVEKMRQQVPEDRPSAADLLHEWESLRAHIKESLYRWRLGPKSEPPLERVLNDTVAVAWEGIYHLKKFVRN